MNMWSTKAPRARVFRHYWEYDRHTDHLHTNPVSKGEYYKYCPSLCLNQEIQRTRAISKRVLIRKIKEVEKEMSRAVSTKPRFGKQFQLEVYKGVLDESYPYYMYSGIIKKPSNNNYSDHEKYMNKEG